ncbi:MAG TPA: response regulator [Mucilaginibacter sp.]|nr:response regulator [Mucilaginibacter sp.]
MKRKVLIIENDQDIRNLVSFILEEEGFETFSCPEPKSLEEIHEFKPHVILIDEFINNQPGHRFCLKIKQSDQLKHIPVIILSTANNIELIVDECKANDYVRKPFDIQVMVDKVMNLIDNTPLTV